MVCEGSDTTGTNGVTSTSKKIVIDLSGTAGATEGTFVLSLDIAIFKNPMSVGTQMIFYA